jgi:sRNA-binding regulator protein Hfq
MSLPKQGESVRIVLRNGETVEGVVEWLDGNGVWIKNLEKSRWVPVETFLMPQPELSGKKESGSEE